MRVQDIPPLHLTYCLNVHPGETWAENFASIREEATRVRDHVAPNEPFGLGLRLGAQAVTELASPTRLRELREFLANENLYVFTINGFSYGRFHQAPVKQRVYRPDWTTSQRLDYTIAIADILAALLPDHVSGSVSTVPCSYKGWITSDGDVAKLVQTLAAVVAHLARIHEHSGKDICLCLEPEPDCYIENTEETIAFFRGPLASLGTAYLKEQYDFSAACAEEILFRHLGVCYDTAHMAVQFENLAESLTQLRDAGIRVGKIQLSSALRLHSTPEVQRVLRRFCDKIYLHQVKVRSAGHRISSFPDLPDALEAAGAMITSGEEWRVHFHVPLFFTQLGGLTSTSFLFTAEFRDAVTGGLTEHLEIETYTLGVLPEMLRIGKVSDAIEREYQWVFRNLLNRG